MNRVMALQPGTRSTAESVRAQSIAWAHKPAPRVRADGPSNVDTSRRWLKFWLQRQLQMGAGSATRLLTSVRNENQLPVHVDRMA